VQIICAERIFGSFEEPDNATEWRDQDLEIMAYWTEMAPD
jgi:hypothetical protein